MRLTVLFKPLLLMVLCCACFGALADCPNAGKLPLHAVKRVVDGDTLRLADGRSVRLIGINAPEIGYRGNKSEPYAKAAKAALQKLVAASGGKIMVKEGSEGKDHYGRTLAYLYDKNGRSLHTPLLEQGLAYWAVIAPNTALNGCLHEAENKARKAGVGLWEKSPVRRAQKIRRAGFALVQAKITNVEKVGSSIWLQTDGPLALLVPKKRLRYFDLAALKRLKGQEVEVRGWVVARSNRKRGQSRWIMPLGDLSMLERR